MLWTDKVAFINPPTIVGSASYLAPPIGLMQVAAALELACPHSSIAIVDLSLLLAEGSLHAGPELPEQAAAILCLMEAGTYAFSVQCFNLPIALAIAKRVKTQLPWCRIVFGGHHATMLADRLRSSFDCVDQVICGSGEEAILPDARERWLCPAFHLAPDIQRYSRVSQVPTGLVEISRGCPFSCTYCSIPGAFGRNVRHKPISMVLHEIECWLQAGISNIHFVDDVITVNRKYVRSLAASLKRYEGQLRWTAMTRIDLVDELLLSELGNAGCRGILYGVDSGSTRTLARIHKGARKYPDKRLLDDWHKRARINPTYYFLIDVPGETFSDIEATVLEAAKLSTLDPGSCRLNTVRLVPGTPLVEGLSEKLTLNLEAPYSKTLLLSVGEDCLEVWDLVRSHPNIFSTYYADSAGPDKIIGNFLARFGSELLERIPVSMAALASSGTMYEVLQYVANKSNGDEPIEQIISWLADLAAPQSVTSEFLQFEQWRISADLDLESIFLSRVDYPAAVATVISGGTDYGMCLAQDARLYRVAATRN
jgi:Radical SAM superfamily/B12 binding domain